MKILESNILFNSVSEYDEFNQSYQEKNSKQNIEIKSGQNRSSQNLQIRSQQNNNDRSNLPSLIIDKVSISSSAQNYYNSEYSSKVEQASQVSFQNQTQTIEYKQVEAVEKIVSGILDQNIAFAGIKMGIESEHLETNDQNDSLDSGGDIETSKSDNWSMSITRTDIHHEEQTMNFNSRGYAVTEDGRKIDFNIKMELNRSFHLENSQTDNISISKEEVKLTDPLVVNFSGKAPQLSDMTFEFDLDKDGIKEDIHFLRPGSGFLVLDKNNDNRVNDGSELFGPSSGNGFNDLAQHDDDQNNWIDENDAVYSKLSVWTKNEKGDDVLTSLKDANIGAISLNNTRTDFKMTSTDNELKGRLTKTGLFLQEDGKVGTVQQIDLAVKNDHPNVKAAAYEKNFKNAPLKETMALSTRVNEENNKKIMAARLEAQQFSQSEPESFNPFKELLEMIKELREEFQKAMKNSSSYGSHKRKHKSAFDLNQINFNRFGLYQTINPELDLESKGFKKTW